MADIIGVGHLFRTVELFTKRIISLAGPQVSKPRLIETRMGAFLDEVVAGELKEGDNRVISGSPLSGRTSMGELHGFLGRHHRQVTVIEEGREREFLGWLARVEISSQVFLCSSQHCLAVRSSTLPQQRMANIEKWYPLECTSASCLWTSFQHSCFVL